MRGLLILLRNHENGLNMKIMAVKGFKNVVIGKFCFLPWKKGFFAL